MIFSSLTGFPSFGWISWATVSLHLCLTVYKCLMLITREFFLVFFPTRIQWFTYIRTHTHIYIYMRLLVFVFWCNGSEHSNKRSHNRSQGYWYSDFSGAGDWLVKESNGLRGEGVRPSPLFVLLFLVYCSVLKNLYNSCLSVTSVASLKLSKPSQAKSKKKNDCKTVQSKLGNVGSCGTQVRNPPRTRKKKKKNELHKAIRTYTDVITAFHVCLYSPISLDSGAENIPKQA